MMEIIWHLRKFLTEEEKELYISGKLGNKNVSKDICPRSTVFPCSFVNAPALKDTLFFDLYAMEKLKQIKAEQTSEKGKLYWSGIDDEKFKILIGDKRNCLQCPFLLSMGKYKYLMRENSRLSFSSCSLTLKLFAGYPEISEDVYHKIFGVTEDILNNEEKIKDMIMTLEKEYKRLKKDKLKSCYKRNHIFVTNSEMQLMVIEWLNSYIKRKPKS